MSFPFSNFPKCQIENYWKNDQPDSEVLTKKNFHKSNKKKRHTYFFLFKKNGIKLHKIILLYFSSTDIPFLEIIQYPWPPFSCDYIVWISWSFILRAGGKRSNQMCWRLSLCQAEGADQIMPSLAGLCPVKATARSWRSVLVMTATASGPSWARWAQDGSSHISGQSQHPSQLICKTEESNSRLLVFKDDFFVY